MLIPLYFDIASVPSPTAVETSHTPVIARDRPAPAPTLARGELHVAFGFTGGASEWSGDPVGYAALQLGFRLFRFVTPYVGVALGYGRIDQRLLTRLSIGVDLGWTFGRFRPHAFVAWVHQHEESLAAVAQEPAGAVFGIGLGIRHRAGVHAGVGFDVVMLRRANYDLALGPDVSFMNLTYSSGPQWYYLAAINLSGHFRLF